MQDLTSLQAFDALSRYKSLTAAAKAMGLPKSTVSRRLAQLETDLGQALIVRDGNRLHLTEAGQVFVSYCRQILELSEQGQNALQELQDEVSGQLVIVIHQELIRGWAMKVLDRFITAHPGIRLELYSHCLPQQVENLDLWLWLGDLPVSNCRREKLGSWHYALYAAPDYLKQRGAPLHPRDLVNHAWVDLLGLGAEGLTLWHHELGSYNLAAADSRWKTDAVLLQTDALRQGKGVGLLPIGMAERFMAAHPGGIVPCLPEWHTGPVDIACYYTRGRPSRKLRSLLEVLRAECPDEWREQLVCPC